MTEYNPTARSTTTTSYEASSFVVIGGANIDMKCRIAATVVEKSSNPGTISQSVGGVARNIAHNLAQLGASTFLISAVGKDDSGTRLLSETENSGVNISCVLRTDLPTGLYVAVLNNFGDLVISVSNTAPMAQLSQSALQSLASHISKARVVVADTNLNSDALCWLSSFCLKHAIPLAIDPVSVTKADRVAKLISTGDKVFLLTPNKGELGAIVKRPVESDDELVDAVNRLHQLGVENIVVGLTSRGSYASSLGFGAFIESKTNKLIDSTGAGDAAVAATLWALTSGHSLHDAAVFGQAAAAVTCASVETVSPYLTWPNLLQSNRSAAGSERI